VYVRSSFSIFHSCGQSLVPLFMARRFSRYLVDILKNSRAFRFATSIRPSPSSMNSPLRTFVVESLCQPLRSSQSSLSAVTELNRNFTHTIWHRSVSGNNGSKQHSKTIIKGSRRHNESGPFIGRHAARMIMSTSVSTRKCVRPQEDHLSRR